MSIPKLAQLEDSQAEIGDVRKLLESADDDLSCAESCETSTDFAANIESAILQLKEAIKELESLSA